MKFWKKLVAINFLCASRFLKNAHWLNPHCLPPIRNQGLRLSNDAKPLYLWLIVGRQLRANVGSTPACATFYFVWVRTYRTNIGQKLKKITVFISLGSHYTNVILCCPSITWIYNYVGVTFPQHIRPSRATLHLMVFKRWTNKACFIQLTLAQRMYAIR